MGCYRCGSPEGNEAQLCRNCRQERHQEREAHKVEFHSEAVEHDLLYGLSRSIWVRASLLLHAFTICYVILLFLGPLRDYGVVASLLFAVMMACAMVSAYIGVVFWVRMAFTDPMWGFMCVLFPGFVYRYAIIHRDEPDVQTYLIFHFVTLGLTFVSLFLLSAETGLNPTRLWFAFTDFVYPS